MSILVNTIFTNPTTQLWTSGNAPQSYNNVLIGTGGGSVSNTYYVGAESTLQITSADTSGFITGTSYLCCYGFSVIMTTSADPSAGLPSSPVPMLFTLSYLDDNDVEWSSGCEFYYDSGIMASQQAQLGISLPFVWNGTNSIQFSVYNPLGAPVAMTITTQSESIMETSPAPVVGAFFIPY